MQVPLDGTVYDLETGRVLTWCPKDNPVRYVLGSLKVSACVLGMRVPGCPCGSDGQGESRWMRIAGDECSHPAAGVPGEDKRDQQDLCQVHPVAWTRRRFTLSERRSGETLWTAWKQNYVRKPLYVHVTSCMRCDGALTQDTSWAHMHVQVGCVQLVTGHTHLQQHQLMFCTRLMTDSTLTRTSSRALPW